MFPVSQTLWARLGYVISFLTTFFHQMVLNFWPSFPLPLAGPFAVLSPALPSRLVPERRTSYFGSLTTARFPRFPRARFSSLFPFPLFGNSGLIFKLHMELCMSLTRLTSVFAPLPLANLIISFSEAPPNRRFPEPDAASGHPMPYFLFFLY